MSTPSTPTSALAAAQNLRWRPPRPLVGMKTLERVLNRHAELSTPEARLAVAVIALAIVDCISTKEGVRREARRFLLGDALVQWADLVGLEPYFVREVAREAGYLASEAKYWVRAPKAKPVSSPMQPRTSIPPAKAHAVKNKEVLHA